MSVAFVVDASIALAWVLPSQASSIADALLKRIEVGDEAMVLAIDSRTTAGRWDGERLDYEHIFFVLFQHHGRRKAA